ncbi:MAG: hypothetical protein L3J05_04570, partial [Robiginitomaculum sp.]|nr:hypothetical protein [Robiginitomaculum sp.]
VAGTSTGAWDLSSALTLLGAISFLGIAPALVLPTTPVEEIRQTGKADRKNWLTNAFISVGLLFFMSGMVGIWSFIDALESSQFETTTAANPGGHSLLVSASLVSALAGSFAAAWLDDKAGLFLPLSLGLALILIGIISMALSARADVFWFGALSASFGWNFALVYTTAELAHADSSGGVVALSPGIIGLGGALGTVGLGAILAAGGSAVFYATAAMVIALGFLFLFFGANIKTKLRRPT